MNIDQLNAGLESAARSLGAEYDAAPVGISKERNEEIVMRLVAFHRVALDEADDEIAEALGMSILEVWSVLKLPGMDAAMKRAEEALDEADRELGIDTKSQR